MSCLSAPFLSELCQGHPFGVIHVISMITMIFSPNPDTLLVIARGLTPKGLLRRNHAHPIHLKNHPKGMPLAQFRQMSGGKSILHRGNSIFGWGLPIPHWGSSIFDWRSSIFNRGSSIFGRGSSIFHRGNSIFDWGSSIFHWGSSMFSLPEGMFWFPEGILRGSPVDLLGGHFYFFWMVVLYELTAGERKIVLQAWSKSMKYNPHIHHRRSIRLKG